jgi:peptide/nickel transport system ATP-binding protein
MSQERETLVEATGLTKEYPRKGGLTRVVDDVSFTIHRGETLGLVGESGSGKSTVARMLLRLVEPTRGSVRFAGEDVLAANARELRALRRRMQIVFQDPYAALNPRMSVKQILAEPFAIHQQKPEGGLGARLREMLATVALDATALARYPHEFSGGQRQRINIARALALKPEFLVLDEPVSALEHGLTYLFISHSMPLVRYLCDRVAVMRQGRLVEIGDVLDLCERPREPYTRELIAATPELPA